ncbi:hypothetical protein GCM10022381_31590 [Leifsonia kafniensis]|uniref:Uncharacterized protein n=1 Tax=Leifsonia kafniensis TaxID=475957 RepID=A0ABP7KX56_9MICO
MSFLPKDELEPPRKPQGDSGKGDKGDKKGPSTNRIIVWIVVGGVGVYMVASGLIGVLTK